MKRSRLLYKILVFTAYIIICCGVANAQSPEAFSYQAIARDASGNPFENQNVSFRIGIIQGSSSGTEVYAETHNVTTNEFGLVNLEIGNGTAIGSDVFEDINWLEGPSFVEVSIDPNGGSSFVTLGTSQLLSVPYALSSTYAESVPTDNDQDPGNELQDLSIENDSIFISGGNGLPLLGSDVVTSENIADGEVVNDDLADNAVSSSKIKDGTILAADILEVPGIAQGRNASFVADISHVVMNDLTVLEITIPGPGYIFLSGRGLVRFNTAGDADAQGFIMQIDEAEGGVAEDGYYSEVFMTKFSDTGRQIVDQTITRVYFKDIAGTYTFRLEGKRDGDNRTVTVFWPVLTAMYFPVSYGAVQTIALKEGNKLDISSDKEPSTAGTIIDLRSLELKAIKTRLEAEKAERALLEAQLQEGN